MQDDVFGIQGKKPSCHCEFCRTIVDVVGIFFLLVITSIHPMLIRPNVNQSFRSKSLLSLPPPPCVNQWNEQQKCWQNEYNAQCTQTQRIVAQVQNKYIKQKLCACVSISIFRRLQVKLLDMMKLFIAAISACGFHIMCAIAMMPRRQPPPPPQQTAKKQFN